MMTVSYTAKKKERPATGLRILGSESRAKRPKESEQPSKDVSPLRKNSPTLPPISHTSLNEPHLLEWKTLFSIALLWPRRPSDLSTMTLTITRVNKVKPNSFSIPSIPAYMAFCAIESGRPWSLTPSMPKSKKLATNCTIQSPMASYWHRIPVATKTFTYL